MYSLLFATVYSVGGLVFVLLSRGFHFGEVCSPYALLVAFLLAASDYALDRINSYFYRTLKGRLRGLNLPLYMAVLNGGMYLSVYTAGAFWMYRLTGKWLLVPLVFSFGLLSGFFTFRKFWDR